MNAAVTTQEIVQRVKTVHLELTTKEAERLLQAFEGYGYLGDYRDWPHDHTWATAVSDIMRRLVPCRNILVPRADLILELTLEQASAVCDAFQDAANESDPIAVAMNDVILKAVMA